MLQSNNNVAIGNVLLEKAEWKKIDILAEAQSFGAKIYRSEPGVVFTFPSEEIAKNFYDDLSERLVTAPIFNAKKGVKGFMPRNGLTWKNVPKA
jgi:hypothetical protein